ncbi:phosphatidylserine decarboxylase [Aquimarina sp. TRL1]|uniref:phosphatidylserine decarboxylase family protein n=1 Tax=Aquimarina sp. (strain TRL1) TaxID=2736252 RepID=UPI00158E854C|nr:phosphatidylserine decarboxylase family protein [Aquimarina sp. TRL1]QKX04630.1 phosphatidylserine decarboxylase [Aquimarina sp. TRL1]
MNEHGISTYEETETISRAVEQVSQKRYKYFNINVGWLPERGSPSLQKYLNKVLTKKRTTLAPCIQALDDFIESNPVIKYLVDNACKENANILASGLPEVTSDKVPRIRDKDDLLHTFNAILTEAPQFIDYDLVGLPFSAYVVGIDPTLSGSTLFRLPMFNQYMVNILNEWNTFLDSPASNVGFRHENEQWLSTTAKEQYDFPIWKKDSETLPYWKSWNSFFTREFKDRNKERPISDPMSNRTLICPNDGSMYRWRANIKKKDVFWFKDMQYSLSDILSSSVPEQQELIDQHDLINIFSGGYIFQTYLNPYNFHRWWCPANATVLFTPFVVPGCFFNKLVLPDFGGATTASLPYLAEVNARGIIVFKTKEYGHICCIPLGMSEVSTISFDSNLVAGATVTKGQEMGMFNYGGSSFAVIYERLPGKKLIFENSDGVPYDQDPVVASGSSGTGGEVTLIGAKIGMWKTVILNQSLDLSVAAPIPTSQLSIAGYTHAQYNETYATWALLHKGVIDFQLYVDEPVYFNLKMSVCAALVDGVANAPATVRVNGVVVCRIAPKDGNFSTATQLVADYLLTTGQNIIAISLDDQATGQLFINNITIGA